MHWCPSTTSPLHTGPIAFICPLRPVPSGSPPPLCSLCSTLDFMQHQIQRKLGRISEGNPNPTTRRLMKLSGILAWSWVREAQRCLGDAADTLPSLDKPGLHLPKRNKCLLEKVDHLEKDRSSCVLLLQKRGTHPVWRYNSIHLYLYSQDCL